MLRAKLFVVLAVGLSATACAYDSTVAAIPARPGSVMVSSPAERACVEYGFVPATIGFDQCVGREIEAHRYRADQAYAPAPVVYTESAYVPPAPPPPPAGVEAFRDEHGFRYDGLGNRLDARGNIISPQSTRP